MHCPICDAAVAPHLLDCPQCDEPLAPWRTLDAARELVLEQARQLAGRGDYVGASMRFLAAGQADPRDVESLIDGAKALVHLGSISEALTWLTIASSRQPGSRAQRIAELIRKLEHESQSRGVPVISLLHPPQPAAAPVEDLAFAQVASCGMDAAAAESTAAGPRGGSSQSTRTNLEPTTPCREDGGTPVEAVPCQKGTIEPDPAGGADLTPS